MPFFPLGLTTGGPYQPLLTPGNSITIIGNVIDTIQDIRTTATPQFADVFRNQPLVYAGGRVEIVSPYKTSVGLFKGQVHCHSSNSDGANTPTVLVTAYKAAGYDFISLTDHNMVTPSPGVAGITYIQGDEQTNTSGHILSVACTSNIAGTQSQPILDGVQVQSAIAVLAHPNWPTVPWATVKMQALDRYFGIEIYNVNVTPNENAEVKWDELLTAGLRVYGFATDDCHDVTVPAAFNHAWIEVSAASSSQADIVEAIKRGNFIASIGPGLTVSLAARVITGITAASATFEFIGSGGAVLQTNAAVTTASYTIIGNEKYVRIRITRTSDSLQAWSNPIFVDLIPEVEQPRLVRGELNVSDGLLFGEFAARETRTSGFTWANSGMFDQPIANTAYGLFVSHDITASTAGFYGNFRSRGTIFAPTAVLSGDRLGGLDFGAHDGTAYRNNFLFTGYASENHVSATNQGVYITLESILTGTASRAERARLSGAGNWLVGVTSDGALSGSGNVRTKTLELSLNSGTTISSNAGTMVQVVGNDSANPRIDVDSFAGIPIFQARRANGTLAAPSAVLSGETLVSFAGFGYGTTAFSSGSGGQFVFRATENWTDTARGTEMGIILCPTGSATQLTSFVFSNGGAFATMDPAGGGVVGPLWKLGSHTAGVAVQAGKVRVEINGTPYDLLTA